MNRNTIVRSAIVRSAIVVAASVALVVGCSQDDDFNDADVEFTQGMIPHHVQALEMAQLAAPQGAGQDVADLAAQIEAAQEPEIQLMTGWLQAWDDEVPDTTGGHEDHGSVSGMMTDAQMADLEESTGEMFDRMFLEMMIDHHEGAITMAQTELSEGTNGEAKELAQEIIEAQQAEIDHMRDLLAED